MTTSTNKVTVDVTRQHIEWGSRRSSSSCPLALALRDLGCHSIGVGRDEAEVWIEDQPFYGRLPIEAREFVELFDGNHKTEPITFDLELKNA